MTSFEIILDPSALASVAGGAARGQSREQIQARTQNLCRVPDPATARAQYETMLKQMVPDSSEAPGIKRRAVKSIAQLCHWPFPG